MGAREPGWWYEDAPSAAALMLAPLGWLYSAATRARLALTTPMRAARPVICIGNFTAGGAGKTPATIAIAEIVKSLGFEPWTLSRGYGGALAGPVLVEPARHAASDVGDEPLLLARVAHAVVSRDRRAGAHYICERAPANAVILMDDGLQNPALVKDLTLAVVDRTRGFGNGRIIPAGPLRASLAVQKNLADAVIVNGPVNAPMRSDVATLARVIQGPILFASPQPADDAGRWLGRRVVAYAGIANPQRFFGLLERLGANIAMQRAFADHQPFSDGDARELMSMASEHEAELVTTEKDMARLTGATGALANLAGMSNVLRIKLAFAEGDEAKLTALIAAALKPR